MLDYIRARHEAWAAGKLNGAQAGSMIQAMRVFMDSTDQYLERLTGLRNPQWPNEDLEAEIERAKGQYDAVATLWNDVAIKTREQNEQKNQETPPGVRYERPPSRTHDWVRPVQNGFRFECCTCDAAHILDFRVVDGKVEFRAFGAMDQTKDNSDAAA